MIKYCRDPRFSQFFLFFFSVSRSFLKFQLIFSLLFLESVPALYDVNWEIFLTQNFTGQSSFFVGWVCFFVKTWSCVKATFFFSIYLSFFYLYLNGRSILASLALYMDCLCKVFVKDHFAPCTPNVIFEFSPLIVYFSASLEKVDKIFKVFFYK